MARPQLDQIRASGRVITSYNWNVYIVRPPTIPVHVTGLPLVNFRAVTLDEPVYNAAAPLEVTIRGHIIPQPGILRCSRAMTLGVVETDLMDMRKLFVPWLAACYDPITGIASPPELIGADILLQRLNKQDIPIWEYMIFGAFPTDFNDGMGAYGQGAGGGGFITSTVELAYVYFKQGLPGMSVATSTPVLLP